MSFHTGKPTQGTDMTELDPAEALASVHDTRTALADRLVTPGWYNPVLGLAMGVLFMSYASHSVWVIVPAEVAFVATMTALVTAYRRINGVWLNGYRKGRTRRATVTMTLALAVLAAVAGALDAGLHQRWGWIAAGMLTVPLVTVCGSWFDRLLREELADGS